MKKGYIKKIGTNEVEQVDVIAQKKETNTYSGSWMIYLVQYKDGSYGQVTEGNIFLELEQ